MKREFKVLVNYTLNGVAVSQSLYTGPHQKHADNAFQKAGVLGNHGILSNCTVTFFDGFRIRQDITKTFDGKAEGKTSFPVPHSFEPTQPGSITCCICGKYNTWRGHEVSHA